LRIDPSRTKGFWSNGNAVRAAVALMISGRNTHDPELSKARIME
jgi:hypothetical protein